jgi:hypothetical protein
MTKNFIGHSIWPSMVMSLGDLTKFSWQVVSLITLKMIEEIFWASYIFLITLKMIEEAILTSCISCDLEDD